VFADHAATVKVNVCDDPALTVTPLDRLGDTLLMVRLRFVDEVPKYAAVIFPLLVPVFLMVTFMVVLVGHDTFSLIIITPACCVCVPVKVMTQAYVTMTAATAMTINRSVARIGEIPFLDFNILFKSDFTSTAQPCCHDDI
jgi:hypothetical protein